jgi:hypothetical protein
MITYRVITGEPYKPNITKFDCLIRAEQFAKYFKGYVQYFSKGEPYYENI